jgi:uncharacterized protein
MRISDCTLLMLPGQAPLSPDHWMGRWQPKLSTARLVLPEDDRGRWQDAIAGAIRMAPLPVLIIAQGEAVQEAITAMRAPGVPVEHVRGAVMVTPRPTEPGDPLPFPTLLIASATDPNCPVDAATTLAAKLGATFVDAGDQGGIDSASGHGPWPEGLMRLAGFLARL